MWKNEDNTNQNNVIRIFRREEARSEGLVNYARFGISLLYIGAIIGVRSEVPEHSFIAGMAGGILSLIYSIFLLVFLKIKGYYPQIKYISTTLDILILSVALQSFGTFRSFKTVAFLLYFLWIALAAMRFSTRLTITAGLLSVGLYVTIVLQAITSGSVETGSITESFTTEKISLANAGLRILFMAAFSLVSVYIAKGYHGLVTESIDKELSFERERKEKIMVKDVFSRYVTTQVADQILEDGLTLTGEKRHATILFCDIRDFTRISEGMQAEEVVHFLNEYLSLMIDVIFEFGGTLDKFVGDEIMAVFGVPVQGEDDEIRAVSAAVKMREILAHLNDRRALEGKEAIRFGIGIHSGEVVAGNIGSEKRMEYTVIGKSVNLASRIQNLNKHFNSDILITSETYDTVKNVFEFEKQPMVRVKGISRTISTYRVVGRKDAA